MKNFFGDFVTEFGLIIILLQISVSHAVNTDGEMDLVCLTEQPVIHIGDSVRLQAWVAAPDDKNTVKQIKFEWLVTEGKIQGIGADVHWDVSSVAIEPYEIRKKVVAIVRATSQNLGNEECSVEVLIEKKESLSELEPLSGDGCCKGTRGGLISARHYLLPNQIPKWGYGLYSYLLLSAPPQNAEEKARYLQTIKTYLILIQDVEEYLKRHRRPSELNVIYLPVVQEPKSSNLLDERAENVLAAYDYAAAQILLNKLDNNLQKGPYLISVLKPLSEDTPSVPLYLFQDLTGVVPDLVREWVKYFCYLGAQQRDWTEQSLQRFGLTLRNLIAVAGKVTPELLSGLDRIILVAQGIKQPGM